MSGTAGDDVLLGLAGDDRFIASSPGSDTFNGGSGNDTVDYSQTTQASSSVLGFDGIGVNLETGEGGQVNELSATDHYVSIENVTGSNFNDFIIGDDNANVIRGLGGTDLLVGHGGADTLDGGAGTDFVSYWDSEARVVVDLQSGTGHGGDAETRFGPARATTSSTAAAATTPSTARAVTTSSPAAAAPTRSCSGQASPTAATTSPTST
jgi:Ca2+-binding RTX toxin-like protein